MYTAGPDLPGDVAVTGDMRDFDFRVISLFGVVNADAAVTSPLKRFFAALVRTPFPPISLI